MSYFSALTLVLLALMSFCIGFLLKAAWRHFMAKKPECKHDFVFCAQTFGPELVDGRWKTKELHQCARCHTLEVREKVYETTR